KIKDMNKNKNYLLIIEILLATTLFTSCEMYKLGVLEVKTVSNTYGTIYHAEIVLDESKYIAGSEFNIPDPNFYATITGYYWPDESPKSLGYKYKDPSGNTQNFYTDKEERSGREPGENGNWKTNGTSGDCPVGTWYSSACGDSKGVTWIFGSDKRGSFSNKDCNGICTPMVFTFTYTISGNTCNFIYDTVQPFVTCYGYPDTRPAKPANGSITFSCNGNQLTVTSGNGTNVFTKK
ncbi:MAG: hypothetical protein Q7U47_09160, partial [Paludibacter sp.]|nr:hypothetical protein [Paludibacter sp.]